METRTWLVWQRRKHYLQEYHHSCVTAAAVKLESQSSCGRRTWTQKMKVIIHDHCPTESSETDARGIGIWLFWWIYWHYLGLAVRISAFFGKQSHSRSCAFPNPSADSGLVTERAGVVEILPYRIFSVLCSEDR